MTMITTETLPEASTAVALIENKPEVAPAATPSASSDPMPAPTPAAILAAPLAGSPARKVEVLPANPMITSKPPKQSMMTRLLSLGRRGAIREPRSVCFLVAVMVLVDKGLPIDGLITEIGASSVIFRPASTYILDRTAAEVTVRFGDQEIRGQILSVSVSGYDIRLQANLGPETVRAILDQYGLMDPSASRAA
jgi:hypothetical protein